MIAEVRIEMVDPIDFIAELFNNYDKIEAIVLKKLKELIMQDKVKEYGDYLWILSHYLSNPYEFTKVLSY